MRARHENVVAQDRAAAYLANRPRRNHALAAADASAVLSVTEVLEYRPDGSRNFVRKGDVVHVRPSRPGRHDGFDSKVLRIRGTLTDVTGVDVVDPRTGGVRTVLPDRIARKAQTKAVAR